MGASVDGRAWTILILVAALVAEATLALDLTGHFPNPYPIYCKLGCQSYATRVCRNVPTARCGTNVAVHRPVSAKRLKTMRIGCHRPGHCQPTETPA